MGQNSTLMNYCQFLFLQVHIFTKSKNQTVDYHHYYEDILLKVLLILVESVVGKKCTTNKQQLCKLYTHTSRRERCKCTS